MKKCKHNTVHFRFDMPVNDGRLFCGNLSVEGFGCLEHGKPNADIDSVEYEGVDIKPVLELLGGMEKIDAAATSHVAGLFEDTQIEKQELQYA